MKRITVALMSLALILITATSGFAAVLWTAPTSSTVYGNLGSTHPTEWYALTPDLTATQGSGPLTLETIIKLGGNWNVGGNALGVPNMQIFLVGGANTNTAGTLVGYGTLWNTAGENNVFDLHTTINVHTPGIYSLKALAMGYSSDATWTMERASLISSGTPSHTPIPAAFLLLGSGLFGLFGVKKIRNALN